MVDKLAFRVNLMRGTDVLRLGEGVRRVEAGPGPLAEGARVEAEAFGQPD
jgi:hypothetical protein